MKKEEGRNGRNGRNGRKSILVINTHAVHKNESVFVEF